MFKHSKLLLSTVLLASSLAWSASPVHASHLYKMPLIRNAYLYNQKGKRLKQKTLRKKQIIKVSKSKTIKNTKYLELRKNVFVKASNVKIPTKSVKEVNYQLNSSMQQQVQIQLQQVNFQGNFTVYHHGQKVWTYTTANQPNSAT